MLSLGALNMIWSINDMNDVVCMCVLCVCCVCVVCVHVCRGRWVGAKKPWLAL